jgi:hypothetical protein
MIFSYKMAITTRMRLKDEQTSCKLKSLWYNPELVCPSSRINDNIIDSPVVQDGDSALKIRGSMGQAIHS